MSNPLNLHCTLFNVILAMHLGVVKTPYLWDTEHTHTWYGAGKTGLISLELTR